jgi:type II secretory pathway pseudopilin PulG
MRVLPDFSKRLKKNMGFLMIDALVAVVIVAVALVSLSYLYTQGTKASVMSGSSERAMEIAAQRIEFLKKGAGVSYSATGGLAALVTAANSNKIVKPDGEAREYTAESFTEQVYGNNANFGQNKIYKIAVTVSWTDTAAEKVRLETYIAVE